ncbi:MAG: hypothetical protein JWR34_916 [Mycobacterium sp.]|nr:hypothetical protein [Mycobacterium sp.]
MPATPVPLLGQRRVLDDVVHQPIPRLVVMTSRSGVPAWPQSSSSARSVWAVRTTSPLEPGSRGLGILQVVWPLPAELLQTVIARDVACSDAHLVAQFGM